MRIYVALAALLFFLSPSASANPLAYKPVSSRVDMAGQNMPGREHGRWLLAPLSFYARHLSAVDGDRCPSYPSCSAFATQAVRKHGNMRGFLMTVDRLIHERTEVRRGLVARNGDGRYVVFDTVEMNDFWFAGEQEVWSR